jgi:peptide-methionine (R)-S-oxide reductase
MKMANYRRTVEAVSGPTPVQYRVTHRVIRTAVRPAHGDSHLGHVLPDGPADRGGLRYRINSAALRVVHRDDGEAEDYGVYLNPVEEMA